MHLATFLGLRPLPRGVGGTNTHTHTHTPWQEDLIRFGGLQGRENLGACRPGGDPHGPCIYASFCRNVFDDGVFGLLFEVLLIFPGGSSA